MQIYAGVAGESAAVIFEKHIAFDSSVFFYVLLPPIILDAGYNMQQARFFRNIDSVSDQRVPIPTVGRLLASCAPPNRYARWHSLVR